MHVTRWCIDDVCRNSGRCMWAGEPALRCPAEVRQSQMADQGPGRGNSVCGEVMPRPGSAPEAP